VRLLDGLAESASWEVDLSTETLLLVIAQPVLEQGSAKRVLARTNHQRHATYLRGAGQSELNRKPATSSAKTHTNQATNLPSRA